MNPFLDSQAQRNTPRGWLCRCLPKTLFATSKAIEIKSALSARPADALAKTDPELSRAKPEMVEKRVQSGGCGVAALVEPHTTPIAARSSTRIVSVLRFSHPARLLRERRRRGRSQPKHLHSLAAARDHRATTTAAKRVHLPPRARERSLYIPPRSRAGAASRRRGNAPRAKPWPPRRSAGARAHLRLMTSTN